MKRISTGISRLDTILGGGLPVGSLIVLAGAPGTGKTILAQQICFRNATAEETAVYYSTISEPPEKLISHVEAFDFFDRGALVDKVEFINLGEILQDKKEGGFEAMIDEIVRKCFEEHPSVVVVDSAKALRDFNAGEWSIRSSIYQLASRVATTESTLLFVGEYGPEEVDSSPEFSLADGILELAFESHEPVDRRWLRVRKMRGSKHLTGRHSMHIDDTGINIFIRTESVDGHIESEAEADGKISTGVPGLDEMAKGGLPKAGSTLVLGPSGCGKTALALQFTVTGLEGGERCLYVTFQENPRQLVRKGASFGWELQPYLDSGQLAIFHMAEGKLDLDVLAATIRDALAEHPIHRLVFDSLAELVVAARESERFPAFAASLLGSLRTANVSVLTTSETSSLGPTPETAGGLSFLYHNIILLRYIEQDSEVRRAVTMLKMRNSDHKKGLWEFVITDHGFEVQGKLEDVTGLLGWSALMTREPVPPPGSPRRRRSDPVAG